MVSVLNEKPLKRAALENRESELRVAVTMENQFPYLFILDQSRPLGAIVEEICANWKILGPSDYALRFFEKPKRSDFITERNRSEIINGTVMKLHISAAKTVENILNRLQPGVNDLQQLAALPQLLEMSSDITFAQEFFNCKGHKLIISMIESGTCTGDQLAYCLKSLVELMDHGIEKWIIVDAKFIKTVCNCITSPASLDVTTLQSALEILESIVMHGESKAALIQEDITPLNLVPLLQNSNADVQKNCLALINALFLRANTENRKKMATSLQSKSMRNIIVTNLIHKGNLNQEMVHQLYVLQSLLFSMLDESRNTPVDAADQTAISHLQELRQIAFDVEPDGKPGAGDKRLIHDRDFKKLGFQNPQNPVEDFQVVPPGSLALNNIMYFAKIYSEQYSRVVLENSCRNDDHDLPFAKASIELTNVMCDILKIGEMPTDDGLVYYPMFFTHDRPFEEFYCICIQLLNKTWKEMKATSIDFAKVFSVVREQITRALQVQLVTFDNFRNKLMHLTYGDITKIWVLERQQKEHGELLATPIQELRLQIIPEIMELIKRQRLNHVVNGTRFNMKLRRGDKFFYCRLSPNHKVFHYGDCDENAAPSIEQLPNKLAVVDIKELQTGKDCPHVKDKKTKQLNPGFAFTLVPCENLSIEPVNFIANTEETFNIWTDAINVLLGRNMTSPLKETDLDTLLSMEIKLRLLDTEGIKIPSSPPPIPPEPPNYEFFYNDS